MSSMIPPQLLKPLSRPLSPTRRTGPEFPPRTLFFVESRVFFFDNRRSNLIARHPNAEPEVARLCPLNSDSEHRFRFDAELRDRFFQTAFVILGIQENDEDVETNIFC